MSITGYLDLLADAGLCVTIPPWTPKMAKREVGRQKGVIVDSGVATRLVRLTTDQLRRYEYAGAL